MCGLCILYLRFGNAVAAIILPFNLQDVELNIKFINPKIIKKKPKQVCLSNQIKRRIKKKENSYRACGTITQYVKRNRTLL